jgi:protein O-GlcNAc transferase
MPAFHHSRGPEPDEVGLDGFTPVRLEGDWLAEVSDQIETLRPFGRDVERSFEILEAPSPGEHQMLRRARDLAATGRQLEAQLAARRHLEDDPGSAEGRLLLAQLLDQAGDSDGAIEELSTIVRLAPDAVLALVRRGSLYARRGRIREAEADLRQAIEQWPTFAPAYVQLGLTLVRRGVHEEAIGVLREALRLDPDRVDPLLYLGEALQAIGDLPEALGMLQRAAELSPDDPRSYKLMGRVLDRQGRTEEAMSMHRKARG